MCSRVSDTLTKEGADAAVLVSNPHSAWTAVFGSIAKWIWGEDPTTLVAGDETETFTREFSVLNASTGATLDIAADNSYVVTINGKPVGADAGEFNYNAGGQDSYVIPAGSLLVGTNTITFVVTNKDMSGETPSNNPAGLRYKLTVEGTDCGVPEVIENTCVAPSTLEAEGSTYVNPESPDGSTKELQQIVDDAGYTFDVDDDQSNIQQWNGSNNTVDFSVEFLSENAGDKLVFGYVVNGGAFVPVFKDPATDTGTYPQYVATPNQATGPFVFSVPNVMDVVFAIHNTSSNKFYYTKNSSNTTDSGSQHAVVYNTDSNEYVVAFEDLPIAPAYDKDFNDLVVEVSVTDCEAGNTATIIATKIVCSDESYLPDAMGSSHVTDKDTAADFLAEVNEDRDVPVCWLQPDWQFEWGNQNAADGGNATIGHVEGYTTSGLTDEDGTVTMSVPLEGVSQIRVRELLQDGYIPFTGTEDTDTVSAELSCGNDGLHYDNWDFINSPEEGETYYCVAWNVEEPKAPTCDPKVNLIANGSFEAPDVTNGAGWDVFEVGTSPTLVWLADFLGAAPGGKVEIHGGVNGWLASDGVQYTELDSDINGPSSPGGQSAVEIAQNIPTVAGQKYQVSFDFSARPGTVATENSVGVYADGNAVGIASAIVPTAGNQTQWNPYSFNFTALDNNTLFALRDLGAPNNSQGTFVDNVKVTCVPEEDEETGTLIIEKYTEGGNGEFEFSITPVAEVLLKTISQTVTVETSEGYGEEAIPLAEGEYDLTELVPEGWTLQDVDCDYGEYEYESKSFGESIEDGYTIYIEEGDTVTCSFVNTKNGVETETANTTVVSGNTSAGENLLGWMFGRDTSSQTPFLFSAGNASIGTGSLFAGPITNTLSVTPNRDKFIGELFLLTPMEGFKSFKWDFKIGAPDDTVEEQFYMNVYANFGASSPTKFYDCRYDVVATVGSVAGFTTVTFDPSLPYAVTTRGDSPFACPAIPAQMDTVDPGTDPAVIRVIALNMGDTSASDTGVSGYFDKVVTVIKTGTNTHTETYDFEPVPVVEEETPGSNRGRSGSSSGNGNAFGEVLGAATCGPLLTQYLHQGWASNDPSEVSKLQEFLNSHLGAGLPITGIFGPMTFEWVKAFQLKYGGSVLKPWVNVPGSGIEGENTPTGYVYQTTRWQINNIFCPGSEAFPTVLN